MKKLKWLSLSLSLWLLSSCSPKPPDVFVFEQLSQKLSKDPINGHLLLTPSPTCMEKIQEVECGHGVSIMTGREIFVGELEGHSYSGKKWSELKSESVYVPAIESYAPMMTYIINSCQKNHCDKDVERFKVKVDSLRGITDVIKKP